METKIYLAIPYSHKDKKVREHRFQVACRVAKSLILQGYIVYCPVISGHHLKLPMDWQFWEEHDIVFLEWCDEVWVITLLGWEESEGTRSEIQTAKLYGKKRVYVEAEYE